jgi:signal transduction histidine kinase
MIKLNNKTILSNLRVIVVLLFTIHLFGQSRDYFQNRVNYFENNFGKGNVDTRLTDVEDALQLKDSLVFTKNEGLTAELLKTIGKMYQQIGHMSSAERTFIASIKAGEKYKDSIWVANTYSRLGDFYSTEKRNFLALKSQLRALEMLDKFDNDRRSIPEVYNEIAKAYIQLGELSTAEQFLEKSLNLKNELQDTLRIGVITYLYAEIYRLKKEYKKAEEYYLKDIPKRERQKNFEGLVISYLGLGDNYMDWKKYNLAEQSYLQALKAADTIKRYRTIGLSLVKLGDLYIQTKRYAEAEIVFSRAISECTNVDSRLYQLSAYYSMYELNKVKGNLNSALSFLEKYNEINDLNTKESIELKSEDMKVAYELEERENEMQRMDEESKRNLQIQKILILGITLLILLSGFLVYLYFARNKILLTLSVEQENTKNLLKEKEALLQNLEDSHHKLVHSEKMASIGVMTAGIAHELNNPISSIHASAEALKMDYEEMEPLFSILEEIGSLRDSSDLQKIKEVLINIDLPYLTSELKTLMGTIMNGSQRTSEIIQGLKTFTRDSGDLKQPYMIEEGLDAALTLLTHKMKGHVEVIKNYHFRQKIICNASKINQVFLNVIDNAVQAMPEQGVLIVESLESNNHCVIRISDNGQGIEESTQMKIFEPFFTTKEIGQGTGLGLAISYAIIKEHNGDIVVQSTTGKGTTFVISLPLS